MQITTLPEDLAIVSNADITVFPYRTESNLEKSKINLSRNAISFLRSGTKEVVGGETMVRVNKEQFLIMKSGNCLMTEKVSDQDRIYKSTLLFFSDIAVLDFLERHDLTANQIAKDQSFYTFRYDRFIEQFVEGLDSIIPLPSAIKEKVLPLKFEEIMLYLTHRYGSAFMRNIVQKMDDKTTRLINVVEHNRYEKLSLDELA
ncbi:MAG: AraC family transcriptional regulator, partial [Bacteroidota bacterium]